MHADLRDRQLPDDHRQSPGFILDYFDVQFVASHGGRRAPLVDWERPCLWRRHHGQGGRRFLHSFSRVDVLSGSGLAIPSSHAMALRRARSWAARFCSPDLLEFPARLGDVSRLCAKGRFGTRVPADIPGASQIHRKTVGSPRASLLWHRGAGSRGRL